MNLFTDPKEINPGDAIFMQYDDKIAHGVCKNILGELIEVDYTTENSTESKIDRFRKGVWKK